MKQKIFVSHSHAQARDAESLAYALRAAGYEVFFDKHNQPSGSEYNASLRKSLQASDLVIFMVTPEAVRPDSFFMAEVEFASQKWPDPVGHVLVLPWADTPSTQIPPYLLATSAPKLVGNKIAIAVQRVDAMLAPPAAAAASAPAPAAAAAQRGRRLALLAGVAALVGLIALFVWWRAQRPATQPAPCLMRLTVLAAPEPASEAHLSSPQGRRSATVIDGVALPDFVGLTEAPPAWTLQLVLADGRPGGRFELRGCPARAEDMDDGRGTRIRIEPRP